MKDYKIIIPAGERVNHPYVGQYVRLLTSSDSTENIKIETNNNGDDVSLKVGRGIRFEEPFTQLYFEHESANDITITLTVGQGASEDVDYSQTGEVVVTNDLSLAAGTTIEENYRAFNKNLYQIFAAFQGEGAAQEASILIENPTNSSVNIVLHNLSFALQRVNSDAQSRNIGVALTDYQLGASSEVGIGGNYLSKLKKYSQADSPAFLVTGRLSNTKRVSGSLLAGAVTTFESVFTNASILAWHLDVASELNQTNYIDFNLDQPLVIEAGKSLVVASGGFYDDILYVKAEVEQINE